MQQITLIGNLTRDPEMRYTPSGKPVTNVTVAVNEKYGDKESTTWFRITFWNKPAEIVNQYLKKGAPIFIQGRLKAGPDGNPVTYQTKDGATKAAFEVTADIFKFLGGKRQEGESTEETYTEAPATDEIPFA